MAFAPPFQRPFSATFDRRAAAAAVPWWLSGGVAAGNAVAVYQPKGAASLAASYVNLANSGTYDAAPGVAPTFDAATGWTGNGSAYLKTGIFPASGWSAIVRFSDAPNGYKALFGSLATASRYFAIELTGTAFNQVYWWSGGIASKAPHVASGIFAIAGSKAYRSGVDEGVTISAWSGGAATSQIYLLAANPGPGDGTANRITSAKIQAVAIYNTTLTAPQVAAISAAMAAL